MTTIYKNMKKFKLALVGSMLLFSSLTFAQTTTKGFNYQAVARDMSGNPMVNKNITVELSVREKTEDGILVWQEKHQATTNEFGLFSFVIGEGVTTGWGNKSTMDQVNWANGDYYIQVKADFGNGFVEMGTSKLQAVPYSLVADSAMAAPRFPLSQATDVQMGTLTPGMVLQWNGTKWVSSNALTDAQADGLQKLSATYLYLQGQIDSQATAINSRISADSATIMPVLTSNNQDLYDLKNLPNGKIFIGDVNNRTSKVDVTGDVSLTSTGVVTIAHNAVTNDKLATGIDAAKLADGSISNSELQHLDGIVTNVQTQLNELSTGINATNSSVDALGTTVTTLQNQVNGDIASINTDITNIKTNLQTLNGTSATLQTNVNSLGTEVTSIQGSLLLTNTAVTNLQGSMQNVNNSLAVTQTLLTTTQTRLMDITNLENGKFYIGNSQNEMSEVAMSGDATMTGIGELVISNNAITGDKIKDGAVSISKIGATGQPGQNTFLRGDGTWASVDVTIPQDLEINSLSAGAVTGSTLNGTSLNIGGSNPVFSIGQGTINAYTSIISNSDITTYASVNANAVRTSSITSGNVDVVKQISIVDPYIYLTDYNNSVILIVTNAGQNWSQLYLNSHDSMIVPPGETVTLLKTGTESFTPISGMVH